VNEKIKKRELIMNAPVDYPINDEARTTRFSVDELRYAAILDRKSAEQSAIQACCRA